MTLFYRDKALKAKQEREKNLSSRYRAIDGFSNTRLDWQKQKEVLEVQDSIGIPKLDFLRAIRKKDDMLTFEDVTNALSVMYAPNTFVSEIIHRGFAVAGGSFKGDMRISGIADIGGSVTVKFDESRLGSVSDFLVGFEPCYLHWSGNKDIPVASLQVELSGKFLERLCLKDQLSLLRNLSSLGFFFTRIDLCFDDHAKKFPVEWVYNEVGYKNYVGFRRFDTCGVTPAGIKEHGLDGLEFTFYFGSRESEKYTRVYETFKKHGYHAYRVECEFKGTCCRQVVDYIKSLVGDSDSDYKVLYGLILGHIDFREESSGNDHHLDRRDRLSEWQEYLDYIDFEAIRVTPISSEPSLLKTVRWLHKQVSRQLAKMGLVSFGFVQELIEFGKDKLRHSDLLETYNYKGLTRELTLTQNM